jgi:hypothetical protein
LVALVLLAYVILTPTIRSDMSLFELALALLFFCLSL